LSCSSTLEMVVENAFDESTVTVQSPLFFRCLKFICSSCSQRIDQSGVTASCSHRPSCPVAPVSTSSSALEEILDLAPQTRISSIGLPSKVEALILDLKGLPPDVKWYFYTTISLLDSFDSKLTSFQRCVFDLEAESRYHRNRLRSRISTQHSIRWQGTPKRTAFRCAQVQDGSDHSSDATHAIMRCSWVNISAIFFSCAYTAAKTCQSHFDSSVASLFNGATLVNLSTHRDLGVTNII